MGNSWKNRLSFEIYIIGQIKGEITTNKIVHL